MKTILFMLAFALTATAAFAQDDIQFAWSEHQNTSVTVDLPPAIYNAVQKHYPGFTVISVFKSPTVTTNGTLNYLVDIKKGYDAFEVEFSPEGKKLSAFELKKVTKDMKEERADK